MRFTVFTPVYNRRDTMPRVWESLRSQTNRDFEWIVIDDGSKDGVLDLLREYQQQADFPMIVERFEVNRGKHVAWNRAAALAQGELFVVADSDDAFVPESLAVFEREWSAIDEAERRHFAGITVLCKDSRTNEVIGERFPASPFDTNALELAYVHEIGGEKWGCVRTDLTRAFPFPEVTGSHFAESFLWFHIARTHKTRCLNEVLRIFFDDPRPDRLTQERRAAKPRQSYESAYVWNYSHLNMNGDYMTAHPREVIVTLVNLSRSALVLRRPFFEALRQLERGWHRLALVVLHPLALALYARDLRRGRIAS